MAEDRQHPDDDHDDEPISELSLDDLGAAYARVAAQHDPEAFGSPASGDEQVSNPGGEDQAGLDAEGSDDASVDDDLVTPEAIVEAALFIGHPENKSLTEQRLASLMRDVSPEEVVQLIDALNQSYREADQALRIVRDDHGYKMTIAAEVENMRGSFLGKVREARLSQMAIEVLALVAYQPGITAQKVQDQRGRESGALLSQLVRRQLLRFERKKPAEGGRAIPHYYPSERFLVLFGLESIDDLPHVEESLREA
jgi:segregation and condensation protein B